MAVVTSNELDRHIARYIRQVNTGRYDVFFISVYVRQTPSVCKWLTSDEDQNIQSYRLHICLVCSQGQSEHDPLKIFEKGCGHGDVTLNFLRVKC